MVNKTEAVVLNCIPFKDSHQLVTIFTLDLGMCRAIGPFSRLSKNALFGMLTPLNLIEVSFRPSRSDLLKIETASLLNAHLQLRINYERLTHACTMLSLLAKAQFPFKPAPLVFILLKNYLNLMLDAKSPEAVLASFQLKILRHEGLISVTNRCGLCGLEPKEIGFEEGRTVCKTHSPSIFFNEEETAYFYALALSTSTKLLRELEIPDTLLPKTAHLFNEIFLYNK